MLSKPRALNHVKWADIKMNQNSWQACGCTNDVPLSSGGGSSSAEASSSLVYLAAAADHEGHGTGRPRYVAAVAPSGAVRAIEGGHLSHVDSFAHTLGHIPGREVQPLLQGSLSPQRCAPCHI